MLDSKVGLPKQTDTFRLILPMDFAEQHNHNKERLQVRVGDLSLQHHAANNLPEPFFKKSILKKIVLWWEARQKI